MTVGLAASVLIATALGATGWTWVERGRIARIATRSDQVNAALQEATGFRGQAQGAAVEDLVPWTKALAAADKARHLLEPGLDRLAAPPGRGPVGGDYQRERTGRCSRPSGAERPPAAG